MAFIEVRNVAKSFRSGKTTRHVLDRVNLSVEEGEFISVIGYSGSGKTTLLSVVAGLVKPDSGEVSLCGKKSPGFPARASIVFQNYSLLPWFSALENVRLAVEASFPNRSRAEQHTHAVRYLEMVGLGNALHKLPKQLSGGMRQRVAIARAFASEPKVLFLDEPFGALDALTRANLQQELARMCSAVDRRLTILMITNNVNEAILLADRIVPMTHGPRATLGPAIPITLERPRTAAQLVHDPAAVHIQGRVVEFLTSFAGSAVRESRQKVVLQPVAETDAPRITT